MEVMGINKAGMQWGVIYGMGLKGIGKYFAGFFLFSGINRGPVNYLAGGVIEGQENA
jgi:hypothetical protein